jgi:hypothetical protein
MEVQRQCLKNWLLSAPSDINKNKNKEKEKITKTYAKKCTQMYLLYHYTGRFIMLSLITNIYNKKTKGPTLMELFTATGKLEKFCS